MLWPQGPVCHHCGSKHYSLEGWPYEAVQEASAWLSDSLFVHYMSAS
ncbi:MULTISPECIES: transposase [unclassified Mesorhizobium]|nr:MULTISPECIES: transposase [unclassified Mesorhizobium]